MMDRSSKQARIARDALTAVFVGALLLVGILAIALGENPFGEKAETSHYPLETMRLDLGTRVETPEGPAIKTDAGGRSALSLTAPSFQASDISYIEMEFTRMPEQAYVRIAWSTPGEAPNFHVVRYPGPHLARVFMDDIAGWEGEISFLAIVVETPGADSWSLSGVSLKPGHWTTNTLHRLHGWSGFTPWRLSSTNFNWGVSPKTSILKPVPTLAAWLALCLLAYAVIYVTRRHSRSVGLTTCGLIVLLVWISMDVFWQFRLGARSLDSYGNLFHLSQQEKQEQSRDAWLYQLAEKVKNHVSGESSRIFLAGKTEYHVMLMAYHLFPENVYWNREDPGLLPARYLRAGDHVVLMYDSEIELDPTARYLLPEEDKPIPVQRLLNHSDGTLVRVR